MLDESLLVEPVVLIEAFSQYVRAVLADSMVIRAYRECSQVGTFSSVSAVAYMGNLDRPALTDNARLGGDESHVVRIAFSSRVLGGHARRRYLGRRAREGV